MFTRRHFTSSALLGGSLALAGCSQEPANNSYEAVADQTWQLGALNGFKDAALSRELVRYATLAPSSHNTQCWTFALESTGRAISIQPDLARLCPAVDPDLHHVFTDFHFHCNSRLALPHALVRCASLIDP